MKKTEQDISNSASLQETHWEMAAKTRMGKYLTEIETVFIKKAVDFSKTEFVLDVGAESGRISLIALNTKTNVVSIDIDRASLKRLRQRTKQAYVVVADARYLPFKSGFFDAAFMIEVLDYIPELSITLNDCNRVLKSGSSCILSFGNKSSFKGTLKGLRGKPYLHSFKVVVQVLSDSNFVYKSSLGFNWMLFGRTSQNGLVPFFAWLERVFRLRKLCKYSPWIICHVIKQLNNT
ncbi:MAG: class I SAM-dependent methyltransferase [Nitrososphaerota archaeon]|jgi:ubiquinone/menaquinone biosynthesis C-methylase UbiE|nr:class I SAM-dependent methyltransferase [Nitrososphaerota archaeon]